MITPDIADTWIKAKLKEYGLESVSELKEMAEESADFELLNQIELYVFATL